MQLAALRPLLLSASLVTGCAQARGATASPSAPGPLAAAPSPNPPPALAPSSPAAIASPPRRHAPIDDLQTARLDIDYRDVGDLAAALDRILDVDPAAGPVRALLTDRRSSSLYVIGTPAGIESVRRLLGPTLLAKPASM